MVQQIAGGRRRGIALVCSVAVLVLATGVRSGTFVAADTDPYGYVSAAELIASGTLHVDQRFTLAMAWRDAERSFVPAGYKPATTPGFIVPTFPLGLPAVMAVFLRVTGHRDVVFYVVPLLGALTIVATGVLGARVHSWLAGAAAAALLATSPVFVLQTLQPVSDVPATAWWTLALALVVQQTRGTAAAAGLAASMAILTRPNLVPLAGVMAAWLLWSAVRKRAQGYDGLLRFAAFVLATVPGCLAVAALNQHLYGSPLSSGYAPFRELYRWEHVLANLDRYPRWLLSTQTPFIFLGVVTLWSAGRARHVGLLFALAAGVFLSYLPYGVFGRHEWGYTRFLLPAFPALLVLAVSATIDVLTRLLTGRRSAAAAVFACLGALALWQARTSVRAGVFSLPGVERRYADVGRYVARMPEGSIFIGALHAGSIRYYSRHQTMDYNGVHPRALEDAVRALTAQGRRPFFVLEEGEEAHFRWVFDTYTSLGRLDWPPAVTTSQGASVRIYDPADRQRYFAGQPIATYDIEVAKRPVISQR